MYWLSTIGPPGGLDTETVPPTTAISALVLGGLWVAFARAAGFTPIVLPWPLIGMITGASALIGVVAATVPALGSRRPG
jgi:hypothetical protein